MSTDTDTLYMAALAKRNDELEDENKGLKALLREIRPNLKRAFYANYNDQNKADELIDRISEIIGEE